MSTTRGGAASAQEDTAAASTFRRMYEDALIEAERDARELVRLCAQSRPDLVEAAARAASLSAARLAGFAANLGVSLILIG